MSSCHLMEAGPARTKLFPRIWLLAVLTQHESGQLSAWSTPAGCRAGLGANRKGHGRKGPRPWWPTSPSKGALRPWRRTLAKTTAYQFWHSIFYVLFLLDFSLKHRPQGGMAHWGPTQTPSGAHQSDDCFQMSLAPGSETLLAQLQARPLA